MRKVYLSLLTVLAAVVLVQVVSAEEAKRPEGPRPEMKPQRPNPEVMFKRLDANHDGAITPDEVPAGMPERLKQMLLRTIKSHDGKLTLTQLTEAIKQHRPGPRPDGGPAAAPRQRRADGKSFEPPPAWNPGSGGPWQAEGKHGVAPRPWGSQAGPPQPWAWYSEGGRSWHSEGGSCRFCDCPCHGGCCSYAYAHGAWSQDGKWESHHSHHQRSHMGHHNHGHDGQYAWSHEGHHKHGHAGYDQCGPESHHKGHMAGHDKGQYKDGDLTKKPLACPTAEKCSAAKQPEKIKKSETKQPEAKSPESKAAARTKVIEARLAALEKEKADTLAALKKAEESFRARLNVLDKQRAEVRSQFENVKAEQKAKELAEAHKKSEQKPTDKKKD